MAYGHDSSDNDSQHDDSGQQSDNQSAENDSQGKDSNEGGEGRDSTSNWFNRKAVNAVNDPKDMEYATNLVDTAKEVQRTMGWEYAKSFASVVSALASANPKAALDSLEGFADLPEKEKNLITEKAQNLIDEHKLDPSRKKDISTALGNLMDSRPKGTNTDPERNGAEHYFDDINISGLIPSGDTPSTTTTSPSTTLNSNLKEKLNQLNQSGNNMMSNQELQTSGQDWVTDNRFRTAEDWASESGPLSNNDAPTSGGTSEEETNTNYQYDGETRQAMQDYFNSFYDTAFEEYQKKAAGINEAVNKRNTILGELTDDTKQNVADYKTGMTGANDQQAELLNGIISKLSENNNLDPVSFTAGGNEFSFVPRPNRDTAQQVANLGQTIFSNANTTNQGIFDVGNKGNSAINDYSNSTMINDILKAETKPTLDYMDKLKELVDMENTAIGNDKGLAISQERVDNEKPGTLDKILGYATLAKGASDLFSW